ncbi:twitching motility protein PilT [Halovivax limisalsi]|uniref:twitching motility protein PilT n=1 Tax=Halovivax limisalsi TaxID=1453760 RepID=UPI001FFCE932|nr:twitching motility protein PilT [Halovivax limisalsi]
MDRVGLLLTLPRLATVDAVRDELERGVETHPYIERAVTVLEADIPVSTPSSAAERSETELLKTLDPGEVQALAVVEAVDGTLVTDDGDARATAKQRGVTVTGSIGLLARIVEDGQISADEADTFRKRWIDEAGFRSPAREFGVFLEV